jgi:hypothetical protein
MYSCSVCKKAVLVDSKTGKITRTCEHTNAAVAANISAHARGKGGVKT